MTVEQVANAYRQLGIDAFYTLDYHHDGECRWVRCPFLTFEEVMEVLNDLPYYLDENGERVNAFHALTITPESQLNQLRKRWDDEKKDFVNEEFTERHARFGARYEGFAERITGERTLTRGYLQLEANSESLEDWVKRVEEAEALEMNRKENPAFSFHEYRKQHGAPSPFLMGNGHYREEMPGAEQLKEQVALQQLQKEMDWQK